MSGGRPALALAATVLLSLCLATAAPAAELGKIAGTVTDAETNMGVAGVEVCAYPPSSTGEAGPGAVACASSASNGEYAIPGLASGEYLVEFSVPSNGQLDYLTQYYDARSSESAANEVMVQAPATTAGVDAQMLKGGVIDGRVSNLATGAPLAGIEVCALQGLSGAGGGGCATTAPDGSYAIPRLATGSYEVVFSSPFEAQPSFITQYYNDRYSSDSADAVSVLAGTTVSGIDAALQAGGEIAGTVTDAATGAALRGVLVCAISLVPQVHECAITDDVGHYLITGLPSADYQLRFSFKGYLIEYYDNRFLASEATVLPLFAGEARSGIDAAMQAGPAATPTEVAPPTIAGAPTSGAVLSCSPGAWAGKPSPSFTYQWLLDGTAIEGATEADYRPTHADVAHSLSCQVSATNVVGGANATSAPVEIGPDAGELPRVVVASRRLLLRGRTVAVKLECFQAPCIGEIALAIRRGRGAKSRVQIATGRFSLGPGSQRTIGLRVRRAGDRRALANARRHPLSATLSVSTRGGGQLAKALLLL